MSNIVHHEGGQLEHAMSVQSVLEQIGAIQSLMEKAMKPGEHYGIIPGTSRKDKDGKEMAKPSLLKPGAEKIGLMFRLAPSYTGQDCPVAHPNGHLEYRLTCTLTHIRTGEVWGQGVGSCSTLETKYRFRNQKTDTGLPIPDDYKTNKGHYRSQGFVAAKDDAGAWYWAKLERVEHDNPADYYNTVLKIAKKRAMVDATLTATAASDFFTQDLEDMAENGLIGGGGHDAAQSASPKADPPATPTRQEQPAYQQPPDEYSGDGGGNATTTAGYIERLRDAIGGDTGELFRLTSFVAPDGKKVNGKRRWEWVSEPGAKAAFHRWEKEQLGAPREPGQEG